MAGAGLPLPVAIENDSKISDLRVRGRRLAQRTLFQYGAAANRASRGQSKRTQDYLTGINDSLPWGDHQQSGREINEAGMFCVWSHNVNGLSKANFQSDVMDFARAMKDKAVAVFGIQETNRNFERRHMLDSFHKVINGISSHHQGAVASAKVQWPTDYQPGGTAVSVRNHWA